ncbi:hypothetical protein [Microbacterium imperiale]|uniref:Uncharacterized protein n=1 Tax=Microbacterium imperiale TaxID=33884 RepID=A0A9W6M498_9MICO|nr:hypothetical protein [Microbacterium imperiale]MBP2421645.1 hypothetical protein [Microbacterium imperiale]MDS0199252.1 hypothetical protein [Microbacterium imperiale]BFE41987.1 hypothetical protein GCM10017544_29430 [Microbacterium imperiale]GLJ80940.1 hypothetical protein GCM10017586_26230 [Microbacterium imperiale]
MSLNNNMPIVPPGTVAGAADDATPTKQVDGEEVLDDDMDDAQVSSINADRAATQTDGD